MRYTTPLFAFLVIASILSPAETKKLHEERNQVASVRLGTNNVLTDVACDKDGDTFFTVWDPATEEPADSPLLMLDSAGNLKGRFKSSRKTLALSSYEDHWEPTALLPSGGVARLVWSKDTLRLGVFSVDGNLQSRVQLDAPAITPYQVAVFPSGAFLVSGLRGGYKSFTALYDKSGHLEKTLYLPDDSEIDSAAKVGDSRYSRSPMAGNRAISSGRARLGEDGNVYLMRRTSPAIVYVISPSGEILRRLRIEPAEAGQLPLEMQIAGGRLALEFSLSCSGDRCEGTNFTVADAMTGRTIIDYAVENSHGVFSCYNANPERFNFLTITDGHQLKLTEAIAK